MGESETNEVLAELRRLLSREGTISYIAEETGLSTQQVSRIYDLGQPWPLGGKELDFASQAERAGVDLYTYMAGIAPLLDLDFEEKSAKLQAVEEALAQGETPEPIPELENPILSEHVQKVGNISNEPDEVVWEVVGGIIAHMGRVGDLTKRIIELRTKC